MFDNDPMRNVTDADTLKLHPATVPNFVVGKRFFGFPSVITVWAITGTPTASVSFFPAGTATPRVLASSTTAVTVPETARTGTVRLFN